MNSKAKRNGYASNTRQYSDIKTDKIMSIILSHFISTILDF